MVLGVPTAMTPTSTTPRTRALGALLVAPALLALVWSYLLPTIDTVAHSFERFSRFRSGGAVGAKNYETLESSGFWESLGVGVVLALAPILVALVVAPILAVAAHHSGIAVRRLTRVLLALPLVCYAPVAFAVGWKSELPARGLSPAETITTILTIAALGSFGLVVAIAATLFLSAVRGARPVPAAVAVATVLPLGIVAVALQTYTPSLVTAAGLDRSSRGPMALIVEIGFRRLDLGAASAMSTVLLVVLAVLGCAVVGIILATRTRIELDDAPGGGSRGSGRRGNPIAVTVTIVALAGVLALLGSAVSPWLGSVGDVGGTTKASTGVVLANTWVPPLLSGVVAILVAALAGFGIGVLRPLGRRSELLLLPFAPWLFVGDGPLLVANYLRTRDQEQINTFLGLVPPSWVCVPALLIFTLFFSGQYHRSEAMVQERPRMLRTWIVPALPLVGIVALLGWFISSQQVLWPLLVAGAADLPTAPVAVLDSYQRHVQAVSTGAAYPMIGTAFFVPIIAVFAIVFAAAQVLYLDRLTIRVGSPSTYRKGFHPGG